LKVKVIGAGLAGCEASYQLAKRGIEVELYDIKPTQFTPAHIDTNFCELVCSNSLKSDTLEFATGLLKAELRELGSLVIECADECKVPAGKTLSVDRKKFSELVTKKIKNQPLITIINKEITEVPKDSFCIIATGPLTTPSLSENLQKYLGENLYFYDAVAPIISADSIDYSKVFFGNKFDEDDDYINCPMTKDEYFSFYSELIKAERVNLHSFEDEKVFEGCMAVEVMAKREEQTLRFGPLKAKGLKCPDGTIPYACVQLRKENAVGDAYNMVGFQTNLTIPEQKRVFRLINGLERAEFIRYGVMHRNSFINAPRLLNHYFQLKSNPKIFFAGQISGVEGYVESIASGLLCGINMVSYLNQKPFAEFGVKTALGGLANYLECASEHNFQPMHINWGLLAPVEASKQDKKQVLCERALNEIKRIKEAI